MGHLNDSETGYDGFGLTLRYSAINRCAIQALDAMEALKKNVQLISGGPNDQALELAKNHFSEYAAEALCALNDEMVANILQKGANS